MTRFVSTLSLIVALVLFSSAFAATPPDGVHFQGVLRDAAGAPRDGDFDMVFRFFDAESGGSEILVDEHRAAGTGAIAVESGLFGVTLGSGQLSDGSGVGPSEPYDTLAKAFRDFGTVWLQIEIDAGSSLEVLSPRVHVVAAPFAHNSTHFDGRAPGDFLDTGSGDQTKLGALSMDSSAATNSTSVLGHGGMVGADFTNAAGDGRARLGYGTYGVIAEGSSYAGRFSDGGDTVAFLASSGRGIQATSATLAGEFLLDGGGATTYVAHSNLGILAYGLDAGGRFEDLNDSGSARLADGDIGISASGTEAGAQFSDSDSGGSALLAVGSLGVKGVGITGGYFENNEGESETWIATQQRGISAHGLSAGGYFTDLDGSGRAHVGYGGYGIMASGGLAGRVFSADTMSGYAKLAYNDIGLQATGSYIGGYFGDGDKINEVYFAYEDRGVTSRGLEMGGLFEDANNSGYAHVGAGGWGIRGYGNTVGGYFEDLDSSGFAYVGYGNYGIQAEGDTAGGYFRDLTSGTWSRVASSSYKITGTGSVDFTQNHPEDAGKVIVYSAPEGDEVATYTRGRARLVGGEARIPLGETFAWVTNPELGLTAHVTPRGDCEGLAVVSVTTRELVVRELRQGSSNVELDYLVYGLRIGFEDHNVVQPKTEEAPIPAMQVHAEQVATDPSLARYTARTRFHAMRAKSGLQAPAADGAAARLQQAVGVHTGPVNVTRPAPETPIERATPSIDEQEATNAQRDAETTEPGLAAAIAVPASEEAAPATEVLLPVSEPVVPGDLLVIDPERPGSFRRSRSAEDRTVVGVVREASRTVGDSLVAPVALAGVIEVAVDASYGPILPGDLLASSPTPGHAMIATVPDARSVVAKALAALPAGKGRILALVK